MYLHEAMEKLFRQVGRSMTTKEIAEKLNENKWYRKADGSLITPYQIYGRAKGYPELFYDGGEKYSAEEWIVDDMALNKSKTKLAPICGKFRRETIDLKDKLHSESGQPVLLLQLYLLLQ